MTAAAPLVLLLRSPDDGPEDRYVRALEEAGFRAACRPVLRFAFAGDEHFSGGDLREHLAHPDRYAGLVLTSPRAAGALCEALRWLPDQAAAWEARPAYAVGPKTGAALRACGIEPTGEESGSAAALSSVIANEKWELPLLFLCGNRRRDTLPEALDAEGVPFEECVVYETHLRTDLAFDERPAWAVFFSPSGVEAAQQASGIDWEGIRKAAIGPTTAGALEAVGWPPEAVAERPAPEALAEAVAEAVRQAS